MQAGFSSPPPEAIPLEVPLEVPLVAARPSPAPAAGGNRKRKRGGGTQQPPAHASSPAPSDPGTPEVLTSKSDISSRPQLKVSRGPTFQPISEGSQYHKTELIGVNRVGFRYVPAGIKPPGAIIQFRTIESSPCSYRVSWEDRSPFVHVTKDGLGLLGTKGHRSARGNAPVREGKWYMEVKIFRGGGAVSNEGLREGCHVRLGWGRREAPLNGPVGLDGYSYGLRDKTGEKVTLSRPKPYGKPFQSGDVIGMYISLPSPKRKADAKDPTDPAHLHRERIAIDFKGQEMFEMQEYPQSKEMNALMDYSGKAPNTASVPSNTTTKKAPERGPTTNANVTQNKANADSNLRPLPTLPSSRIAFFINGVSQGVAFQDLYDYLQLRQSDSIKMKKEKEKKRYREGMKEIHRDNPFDDGSLGYYPFISLFNDAEVRINPGPVFEFEPPGDIDALLDDPTSTPMNTDPSSDPTKTQTQTQRMWRPLSERYPEFMAEQWEFDEREEQEAQANVAEIAHQEKITAQKKAQREKKKKETEARKRAKIQATEKGKEKEKSPSVGPQMGLGLPQPSPLRHASVTAQDIDYDLGVVDPGTPTPLPGAPDGWNAKGEEDEQQLPIQSIQTSGTEGEAMEGIEGAATHDTMQPKMEEPA